MTFFYHYEFPLYENSTVGCIIFVTVVMCTLAFIVQADTKICKQARGAADFFFTPKKMFSQICENSEAFERTLFYVLTKKNSQLFSQAFYDLGTPDRVCQEYIFAL